jgi:SAM-dependent methyltransferase
VPYDPTIYQGSAAHYRNGRPPYSPKLETVLTQEVGLGGGGRLLDVGCGPGILTIRLAPLFEEAVGVDPDADMIAEGRRAVQAKGRTRFGVPQSLFVPGIPDLLRDTESVLSGYFSMSSSAPHLFRDRLDDFAREVRALLASRSPEGIFWDWPGDTEVVLARKPR